MSNVTKVYGAMYFEDVYKYLLMSTKKRLIVM